MTDSVQPIGATFMILAESPPECAILNGTSEDYIAIWRTAYHAYRSERGILVQ